ncbi:DUF1365 domain-containing protein [Pararhizobium sp.]|uniref:DUF1365 domain-containing protein n=1 Tax=Pararhizobium sp. TaxID=1977563 RepID=UPI0027210D9F|nr:DUF1365 domain-containing protein [Pararhizobium sp.]MDO9416967.1 DUF1365 domain-containing protein [Pararhizobium sp.]
MTTAAPRKSGATMADNGPPPGDAAALYVGPVMHQRMKPVGHRFSYDVFSLMVDLDRLDEADATSRIFSVNRRNIVSFFERDHTDLDGLSIRAYADDLLRKAGLETRPHRILLVCYPRILGRVFNPIAVYYAYDAAGTLVAAIYEVRNTFGERHTYVCPVEPGELTPAGLRQDCRKIFHVSPFIPMNMHYHFRMLPPGDELRWRILETDPDGPLLSATFSGSYRALTTASLAGLLARIPHLTFKIVGAIHWEALKLWLKGVRYIPRPEAPPPVSVRSDAIAGEAAE